MWFLYVPRAGRTESKNRSDRPKWLSTSLVLLAGLSLIAASAVRAEAAEPQVKLGSYQVEAPRHWEQKMPKSSILAYEFWSPAADGDEVGGRLTISSAGGSVHANLERWYGQFTQPDGQQSSKVAKVEEQTVAGQAVHLVDLSGTYHDRPNPMAPGVDRPGYRLLGAIIETEEANFFLKFYGPERTIAAERTAFLQMIESLAKR